MEKKWYAERILNASDLSWAEQTTTNAGGVVTKQCKVLAVELLGVRLASLEWDEKMKETDILEAFGDLMPETALSDIFDIVTESLSPPQGSHLANAIFMRKLADRLEDIVHSEYFVEQ